MKKKAAIFTWCYDNGTVNYGQILQCYAMQTLCEEYGMDTVVIKYRCLNEFEKLTNIPSKGSDRENYEFQYRNQYIENQDTKQVRKFIKFISQNIRCSSQCYSVKDIEEEIKDRDILIIGSDQLWNPLWFKEVYLLEFAKENQRCISIATGGICVDREKYRPIIKKIANGIEKFDYVSVREPLSQKILNCYTDKRITDILDPTLLLDEVKWEEICEKRLINKKYIFVYFLGKVSPHKNILKEIVKRYNIEKIVYIKMNCSNEKINNENIMEPVINAGPKEFLSLIKYSEAVCTDSFHGTAFSIIFKKDFYVVERAYTDNDITSEIRVDNLMEKLKIKKRYANSKKELRDIEYINYEDVEKELFIKRKYCMKEFERAIEFYDEP